MDKGTVIAIVGVTFILFGTVLGAAYLDHLDNVARLEHDARCAEVRR